MARPGHSQPPPFFFDEDVDREPTVRMHPLEPGSFFADRFRVVAPLGTGAMGRVVRAQDLVTGHEVALKVLHRERARDPETLERFRREAEILDAIGHLGIVRVLAMGTAGDGAPWLSLELLHGITLKERLRAGPMHPHEIVPVLNTIGDALAAAHLRGVVHRDLKPENVMLIASGDPPCKILDFGLSRVAASKALTRTGSVLGTPRYMAPEQIRSARDADLRVDVFSTGVMLYEMLTGKSPYPAEDLGQLLGCVIEGRTVPLATLRPDLPPAVSAVIERAMARDPDARFQTAGAIAEAYARALGVRSGRSQLASEPALPGMSSDILEAGASPLVDPFAAGADLAPARPDALPASTPGGGIARPPQLAIEAPSPHPIAPAAAPPGAALPSERGSRPTPEPGAPRPGGPEFTQPRGRPLSRRARQGETASPGRASRRRSLSGWALFVFAILAVSVFAAGAALTLRMLTSASSSSAPAAAP